MLRNTLGFPAAALTIGLLTAPASAAPAAPFPSVNNEGASIVEQAARRCYRHRGHLHCGRASRVGRYHGYGYRSRWRTEDPSHMRVGSRRWWNAKDREGSTGRP
jgi:hypothetical protein